MPIVIQKYKHPYSFDDIFISFHGIFYDYSSKLIKKIKEYYPEHNVYLTNKGRESLNLILKNLNLNEGDEVAIPCNVCEVVVETILHNRLKPLIIDITNNLTLDPKDLMKKKTDKTRAVIVVHQFGNVADLDEIKKSKLITIEDCAQTINAKYKDKLVGNYSDYAFNSLDITKPISAISGSILISKKPIHYNLKKNVGLNNLVELILFMVLNNKLIYNLITKKFITNLKQKQTLKFKIKNKAMSKISIALAYSQYKKYEKKEDYSSKLLNSIRGLMVYSENNNHKKPSYTFIPVKLNGSKLSGKIDLPQPSCPLIYIEKYKNYISPCPNTENLYKELTLIPTHTNISNIKWEKYII
ncbi:MAG: DegT/DnrJ/EryC1/StrS family aminotransferase [Candidatus Nanoarchaeia archaeon]|nr:DegT/DnrJ/EryC1/StrS family aminotransferase [Candidatus Nanoarchaeia archaeon]